MQIDPFSPEILTERLSIRPAFEADIPAIIRYYQENATHFASTDPPRPSDFYQQEYWLGTLQRIQKEVMAGRYLKLFLFPKQQNIEVLGHVEFSQIVRGPFQACYLGYGITRAWEGKGLMQEGLYACVQHAFKVLNLHRIMANHLPDNERSARLLRRLGFEVEAIARDYLYINGAWRDHVLNVLINPEWRNTFNPEVQA